MTAPMIAGQILHFKGRGEFELIMSNANKLVFK